MRARTHARTYACTHMKLRRALRQLTSQVTSNISFIMEFSRSQRSCEQPQTGGVQKPPSKNTRNSRRVAKAFPASWGRNTKSDGGGNEPMEEKLQ
ncbi:hypothetical protein EVAR_13388_1 [Eumeta japonica]|uniref:Uncharacterized protein n=1 Tax=Eumeta variegata TaxID=151549 RepID=A0A4C1TS19_EUMVA|nr:hypothetical protein EVAR_13388_1 [Eumeta japonica]